MSQPSHAGRRSAIALPSAADISRDTDRMLAFGPRLPGHPNHARFVDWLEAEFERAGLQILPGESLAYRRWDPHVFTLDVDGAPGSINRHAYYVRSRPTGREGVVGPLALGGVINQAGPERMGEVPPRAIVVFDASLPAVTLDSMSRGIRTPYLHLPNESVDAYLSRPYRRLWLTPDFPMEVPAARGAAGVVIVMDVSSDVIAGNYSPHHSAYKPPLPALFVGQEEGSLLREFAKAGATARLTLDAEWVDCTVRTVNALLPGKSDEVIILNTHTDGQNFIEENGCLTLLQLARHFASLPEGERLHRSVVFVGWPGHMTGELPEAQGWISANPQLMARAAAAVTIEHLGAPEWEVVPGKGYCPTGRNEYMNMATTRGVLMDLVIDGIRKHDLHCHGVQPGPGVTVGSAFHRAGIPHMGCIAGPNYLLGVVGNGHRDKHDAALAARQTAMLAELIRSIDGISTEVLRAGDASLGV